MKISKKGKGCLLLRELVKSSGLDLKEFCELFSLKLSTLKQYHAGLRSIRELTARRMGDAFKMDHREFLDED